MYRHLDHLNAWLGIIQVNQVLIEVQYRAAENYQLSDLD